MQRADNHLLAIVLYSRHQTILFGLAMVALSANKVGVVSHTGTVVKSEIEAWVKQIKERPDVVALNIGLFQSENGYQAYITGSNEYDPEDDDWACNEDFVPTIKYIDLPCSHAVNWEVLQSDVVNIITGLLSSNTATILNHVPNITVGFDDAELVRVK